MIVLHPAGSLILFYPNSESDNLPSKTIMAEGEEISANSPLEIKRIKDNVLNIDFCTLTVDGISIKNSNNDKNLYNVEACNLLYKQFGMDNPWNHAIQYKQDIVERDTFTTGNIEVGYQFIVVDNFDTEKFKLVVEQPNLWTVKINGEIVHPNKNEFCLEPRFGVF